MRKIIKNILTASEAESIQLSQQLNFDHPLVERIVSVMRNHAPAATITPMSYARVERKADGHDWHCDTGDTGHMMWCAFSASVLLTKDFVGGYFEFKDGARHRHYLDMLLFSSDEQHRVLPHGGGDRLALLVFLGRKNDQ
jgi:hypothetical protein|tara:strand:+ start:1163 stop:1582 length:420 start_codon:yes stop_codon:yes gene_type:complete